MHALSWFSRTTAAKAGALALVLFLTGCATSKIDWTSRIGAYTYDQAVTELGPPDRSAELSDGAVVAEWLTRRGNAGGYGYYYGRPYPYYYRSPWPVQSYGVPPGPDYFIRLTFDPGGLLQNAQSVKR